MANRMFNKEILRSISGSFGRFVAILGIVALGTGFYAGLRMTAPDMDAAADAYYDATQLMDIRVVSTLGMTDEDIDEIRDLPGVSHVAPAYETDVMATVDGEQYAMRVHSIADGVNQLELDEGEWPTKDDECLLSADKVMGTNVPIGDKVLLTEGSSELEETLRTKEFVVTGFAHSPYYVSSVSMGTTTLGSGTIQQFMYVEAGAFAEDYPITEAFVAVDGASSKVAGSDAYQDEVDAVLAEIERIAPECEVRRLDGIIGDAQAEVDDARAEYEEKRADAETELADAKSELDDAADEISSGESKLASARSEYNSGVAELASQRASANAQFADAEGQIADAEGQIADAEGQIAQGQAEITSGERQLKEGEALYAEGLAQFQAGEAQLEAGEAQLADGEAQLAAAEAQYEAAEAQYESGAAQLDQARAMLAQQIAEYEAAEALMDEAQKAAAQAQIAAAQAQIASEEGTLAAAREQLDASYGQLQASRQELESSRAQIAASRQQIEASRQELAASRAQLDSSRLELEAGKQKIAESKQQLADSKQQLADSKQELASKRSEAEGKFADAQSELNSAKSQIGSAESELAQGKADYQSGLDEYNKAREDADAEFAEAEQKIADAQLEVNDLHDLKSEWLVMDRTKNHGVVSFDSDAQRVDNIAAVFPFIFFLVAALVALTTMTRMVEEERMLIGTFKALGYSRSRITSKYIIYALVASGVGSVIGIVALSLILPPVIMEAYAIIYYVPHDAVMGINMPIALLAAGLGIGVTLLSTWFACATTLRESPAALMLPKAPKAGKKILLERIKPLWRKLSFLWKVTFRNIFRYKKRFVMTVIGIAGCTALLLTGLGLQDSINDIIDKQFGQTVLYNVVITSEEDASEESVAALEEKLSDADVVYEHTPAMNLSMVASEPAGSQDLTINVVVPESPDDFATLWKFRERISQEEIVLGENGVVVAEKLANELGLKKGDTIVLAEQDEMGNATNDRHEAEVTGIMENYIASYVFMSPGVYEEMMGEAPKYTSIYANMSTDEQVRLDFANEVRQIDGVKTVAYNDELISSYRTMLRSVNMIVVVLVVAAAALAFIVLYNLTNINITERQREIATLKVLGFTQREIYLYIFRETILLTVIGALLGLVLGIFMESFVVVTAEVDYVMFGRDIHPASFVMGFLLTLVFSLVVMLFMRRKLDNVNMVESLKSNE